MPIPRRFVKMSGGGNDFLVFEADGRALSESDRERIARLCRRGLSVGADGALFLSGGESSRIHLDYFNSDGGLASFCANGTRCAARYAVSRRLVAGNTVVLETGWDAIDAQVHEDGELVSLVLPPLLPPGEPIAISGAGLPATGIPMHVGVPHLVVMMDGGGDLSTLDVERLGPPLRRHPLLPEGANVSFVRVIAPDRIAVRTFERGVEGETLACGSGTVASAVVASRLGLILPPVSVETRSGSVFVVDFEDRNGRIAGAVLRGDAREIFTAELTEEAWQA
jgi:diaminopimelate epimerase